MESIRTIVEAVSFAVTNPKAQFIFNGFLKNFFLIILSFFFVIFVFKLFFVLFLYFWFYNLFIFFIFLFFFIHPFLFFFNSFFNLLSFIFSLFFLKIFKLPVLLKIIFCFKVYFYSQNCFLIFF